jgi:hypothetical protein
MKKVKENRSPIVTTGTILGDRARAKANHFSDEERQSLMDKGMALIYADLDYVRTAITRR